MCIRDSGTASNANATGMAFVPGRVGNAVTFDGVDDFVNVPHSTSLNITGAITVEVWARRASGVVDQESLVRKEGAYMIRVDEDVSGDDYSFFIWIGGTPEPRVNSGIIPSGNWDHIVGTYNAAGGSGNVKIYVNGILRGTSTRTGNIDINTSSLMIGHRFNGLIDEVRIYNRALSAAEVRAIFNATR